MPSLTVNGHPYNGELDAKQIFESVCSSFHYDKTPEGCKADFDMQTALKESEVEFVSEPSGFSFASMMVLLFAVVLINVLILVYCIKRKASSTRN